MAQLERKKSACVKILSGWEDNGPSIFSKIMAVLVYHSEGKGADICGHNKKMSKELSEHKGKTFGLLSRSFQQINAILVTPQ